MLLFFYFFILASPFRGTTVTPTVQAHACYCLCLHLTWSLSSNSACPASLHPQTSSEVFVFFPLIPSKSIFNSHYPSFLQTILPLPLQTA